MIEQLTNCPNCGGALNEAGRCIFCGSKVYDFLSIDFSKDRYPTAKSYVRIKTEKGGIILAPIIVNEALLTFEPKYNHFAGGLTNFMGNDAHLDINCNVCGDVIFITEESK